MTTNKLAGKQFKTEKSDRCLAEQIHRIHRPSENIGSRIASDDIFSTTVHLTDITVVENATTEWFSRSTGHSEHTDDLMASIRDFGLIHTIIVDADNVVICGRQRRKALIKLSETDPQCFKHHFRDGVIPVRKWKFRRSEKPIEVRDIEIAENKRRKDYTKSDIHKIVASMMGSLSRKSGRPSGNDIVPRLVPTIMSVFGRSRAQAQRYIKEVEELLSRDFVHAEATSQSMLTADRDMALRMLREERSLRSKIRAFIEKSEPIQGALSYHKRITINAMLPGTKQNIITIEKVLKTLYDIDRSPVE